MSPRDLERDLKIFADPATEFSAQQQDNTLLIGLIRDGEHREYHFDLNRSNVRARHSGKQFSSISALLASEEFANIRALRATQRRLLEPKLPPQFIPPEGDLVRADAREELTLESVMLAAQHEAQGALSIMLLDGPAGVGKTSLIERLVFDRTIPESNQPPLLHVTSSGSRLTDLSKALAHATQVLRASVTFDQVPVLVRRGVLQVAIDGFDELVDPSGYKDAWSALREFLSEVGSGGPTLLSGRDTFFNQQSFKAKLAERIPRLDLRYARLRSVSPAAAKKYLSQRGWPKPIIETAEAAEWFTPGTYRLRPFFLAQIAENGWDDLQTAHGSPQAFLVNRFISRESKLLNGFLPLSLEAIEAALWNFYCTLVEDMAIHEMDTVDTGYLALALETTFTGLLGQDDMGKLLHRAGSLGLLESDSQGSSRRFPHSEIQNQFLAKSLIESMDSNAAIGSFIRRVPVTMALSEAFADRLGAVTDEQARSVTQRLARIAKEEPMMTLLSSNTAALLLASVSSDRLTDVIELEAVSTTEVRLYGVASAANLKAMQIGHLDVRGADLRAVTFHDTVVGTITVDDSTLFGDTVPIVSSCIQVDSLADGIVNLRAPDDIAAWLAAHSTKHSDGDDLSELPLVRYFDRLCRKFNRQRQIRDNEADGAYFLIRDKFWPEVCEILGERLIVDTKNAHGTNDKFFRIASPEALLNPNAADPAAQSIWQRIIARAQVLSRQ